MHLGQTTAYDLVYSIKQRIIALKSTVENLKTQVAQKDQEIRELKNIIETRLSPLEKAVEEIARMLEV